MDAQNINLLFLITTLVFLLLHVSFVFSVVNVNSTLSTNGENTSWLSPSGDFAFGFRQLNGTSTSSFSVAIWYNKIPDKTIVWHATTTDEELAEAPEGSLVQLTKEGLMLTTPQGDSIWTANLASNGTGTVSYGSMLDSGNFVLVDGKSNNVWESFHNPTDTLLPNQSLRATYNDKLTSRFSETNYTRGRYQIYFQEGDILFSGLAWPSNYQYRRYYNILASANGSRLVFNNTSGDIYVVTTNGTTRVQPEGESWQNPQVALDDPKGYYYRATLDCFGVFTQYAYPRDNSTTKDAQQDNSTTKDAQQDNSTTQQDNSTTKDAQQDNSTTKDAQQGWQIARYVPDNICAAIDIGSNAGSCGYNSYCSLQGHAPTCTCPNGYSLVDPSNQFGGCQPNFTLVCGPGSEEQYDMLEEKNGYFSGLDYEVLNPNSKQECQQSCLHDCLCAAAAHDGSETCTKKGFPLINGQALDGYLIYVKRGRRGVQSFSPVKDDEAKPILLGSLIGSIVISVILLAALVFIVLLRRKRSLIQASETNLQSFTYDQLKSATKDFSVTNELGKGSYGIVYKGTLEFHNVVAVKKLNESGEEGEKEKDFKTELTAIAKTYHKNLVRLIGFCDEGSHRMLVYEFMSNGTLGEVLFGKDKSKRKWSARIEFALGIARGLVYLHEDCGAPVMHCDIKPENVLIDEDLNAKISDFGLAKLLSRNQIATNTVIRGTPGYVAPEWYHEVPVVTTKVDVYSFGVVLLEIICCIRNVLPRESKERKDAILQPLYMKVRIDYLMQNDEEAKADSGRIMKWVNIAMMCIQENPTDRPTMKMVMQMLEDVNQVVTDPPPPLSVN